MCYYWAGDGVGGGGGEVGKGLQIPDLAGQLLEGGRVGEGGGREGWRYDAGYLCPIRP